MKQPLDLALFLVPMAAIVAPAHASDYLSVAQAQTLLFPAARNFAAQPIKLDDAQRDRIKAVSGLRQRWEEQKVWRAETEGKLQGWLAWRHHFVGKTLADPFKLDEDVPNISGATLSCRNVLDGVKRLLAIHKLVLVR